VAGSRWNSNDLNWNSDYMKRTEEISRLWFQGLICSARVAACLMALVGPSV
jgi:hypothetical protein